VVRRSGQGRLGGKFAEQGRAGQGRLQVMKKFAGQGRAG